MQGYLQSVYTPPPPPPNGYYLPLDGNFTSHEFDIRKGKNIVYTSRVLNK